MSFLTAVLRVPLRGHRAPRAELPAPGASPLASPSRETVVILVIITAGALVLLGYGYSASTALGVLAGVGLITTEITARLAVPPARG